MNPTGGTITVNLKLDNKQFIAAALTSDQVGDQLDNNLNKKLGDTADRVGQRFGIFGSIVRTGLIGASLAAVGAGVASVKMGADFEQSLNILKSVSGATGDEMAKLSARARELGKDASLPGVSARDAAEAMSELAKAGVGVNDIMGASKGVLSLAKAGQLEVKEAATIAARALNAFGLSGDKASQVADTLAAGANASSADVGELAFALSQAGSSASRMGVSLGDTITALGLFSNAGINGSDAGTSLKTALQRLAAPTEEAAGTMKQLGLNFFDAAGNFVGLQNTAEQLKQKLAGLTQEQREQAIASIFGADASRVAGVLAKEGAAGFDAMSKAVNRQGAATDLAKAQNAGFKGALDNLGSTLATIGTDVGTKLLPPLTSLFTFIAANAVPVLIGITSGVLALAVAFITLAAPAGLFAGIMGAIFSPITAVILGIGLLAAGIAILQQKFGVLTKIGEAIKAVFDLVIKGDFTSAFRDIFKVPEDSPIIDFILTIRDFIGTQLKTAFDSIGGIVKQLSQEFQPLVKAFQDLMKNKTFVDILKGIALAIGAILVAPFVAALLILVGTLKVVATVLKFVSDNFQAIKNVVLTVLAVVFAPLIAIIFVLVKAFQFLVEAVKTISAIFSTVFGFVGAVVAAQFAMIAAVWNSVLKPVFDAIIFIVGSLFKVWFTIWSAIFEIVFTIISTIAQIIFVILQGVFNFIVNTILTPLFNFFKTIFTGIYNFIAGILGTVFAVVSSIFTAIYNVVAPIVQNIFNRVSSVFNAIYSTIAGIVNAIYGYVSSRFNAVKDFIVGAVSNAASGVSQFVGSFINAGKDLINGIVQGIGNNASAVVNKIKEICSNSLKAVKDFFGIKSPSRVMAGVGANLMLGLTNGIDRTGSAAVSAVSGVSRSILGTVSGLANSGFGGLTIDGGSGGVGGGAAIVQNNNIYNQVDMNAVTTELAWQVRR